MKKRILISLVGPTAVGKTSTAIELAKEFDAEIISSDSRQFYKELSIGTAKPTSFELSQIKHHFVDNKSVQEEYNASDFEKEVILFLDEYFKEKSTIILCGGSGMYVNAILNGFDEEIPTANSEIRATLNEKLAKEGIKALQQQLKELDLEFFHQVDLENSKRLARAIEICLITGKPYSQLRKGKIRERAFQTIKIGLELERAVLYNRINQRVDNMLEAGLLEEVKSVINFKGMNALKTVGYREMFDFLEGEKTMQEAIDKIKVNSRRYAKRQLTWFKNDSEIEWFSPFQKAEISKYIRKRLIEL